MNTRQLALTLIAAAPLLAERFDHKVREDFFAGMTGNSERLERAMKVAEETLKAEPNHAEAMVWHGAGLFFIGGRAFQAGDHAKGSGFVQRGTAAMDKAADLAPDNVAVRIPRGAAYLTASRFMPPQAAAPVLQKGLSDYEHIYALQKDHFETLGTHPRGEMLFGIAEGRSRAGDTDKAAEYFALIEKTLPGTGYAKRAAMWRENKTLPISETSCIGCHVK